MPWRKYKVQSVGGYEATGWIFRKGDGDDSVDNDGEDSYPGGPDDHALVIHSPWQCEEYRNNVAQDERHAPVQDDEITLENLPPVVDASEQRVSNEERDCLPRLMPRGHEWCQNGPSEVSVKLTRANWGRNLGQMEPSESRV